MPLEKRKQLICFSFITLGLLDKALCTQTIKTRLDSISEAGIGIIDATMKDINFDLSIPSDLAVNSPTDNVLELLPKVEAPEPRHGDVKM